MSTSLSIELGRPRIRTGVRVACEPIEAHFCRLVDLVLAPVGQQQLPRDVLDVFGAVWELHGQEPEIDDVVRHDAEVLRERPGRVGRLLGAVVHRQRYCNATPNTSLKSASVRLAYRWGSDPTMARKSIMCTTMLAFVMICDNFVRMLGRKLHTHPRLCSFSQHAADLARVPAHESIFGPCALHQSVLEGKTAWRTTGCVCIGAHARDVRSRETGAQRAAYV